MKQTRQQTESDFLGRLVDKALGRSDAVGPKLPSLFEPPQPSAAAPDPHLELSTQSDHEMEREALSQHKPARLAMFEAERDFSRQVNVEEDPDGLDFHPPRADGERRTVEVEVRTVADDAASPVASVQRFAGIGSVRAFTQPMQKSLSENHPSIEPPTEQTRKAVPVATRPATSDSAERTAPAILANRVSAPFVTSSEAVSEPAIEYQKRETFRIPSFEDRAHPEGIGTMLPKVPFVIASPLTGPRPAKEHAPPPAQELQNEPVINVTIGKIEVRAATGGSKMPRPANESRGQKPMSLADYLKRRGAGR